MPGSAVKKRQAAVRRRLPSAYCAPVSFFAVRFSLLPYHKVGSDKAERLGKAGVAFEPPTNAEMEQLVAIWRDAGFGRVTIGG